MHSLALLKELIPFPSVSSTSNTEVSQWVEHQLKILGCQTEWLEYQDENGVRKACVAGRKGPDTGRGLAYFCHTDVVPVDSWSFAGSGPWSPCQTDDRLYGRGSCDMKGSLACMLAAVASLEAESLKEPVYIFCTADEEIGLKGAGRVVADSAMYREVVSRQSRAVVGEPTLLEVVHAHKGGRAMKITSIGRAAHSSTGRGINANFAMIPFLADVRQLCLDIEDDPAWQDDRYTPPTINLNLGINDHSPAMNITAAKSICTIYFRTMPGINADALAERIHESAKRHGLQLETIFATEPLFTDPDSSYVRELLAITGTPASRTVPYGTDGSCFQEIRDIVVLGPGDIRQAHTDDEWIALDQLERGTDLYTTLIRRWCLD
ncbi:MAG: M20 family metallopeptidase [Fuerstiella sp.]